MTPGKKMPPRLVVAKQSEWGAACKETGVGERGRTGAGAVEREGWLGTGLGGLGT